MPKPHLFYYCTKEEALEIARSGRIPCEDLKSPNRRAIYFSNLSPNSSKLNLDEEELDTYIKLPKQWVTDQGNYGNWTYQVLDGPGLFRFRLEGTKQSLDISWADYVYAGDRYEPNGDMKMYFTDEDYYYHYTPAQNLRKIINSGIIKPCHYHPQYSGIRETGVCLTDAHPKAHSQFIMRSCFRGGGNPNKVLAYIKLPRESLEEYALMKGAEIEQYKDDRRSFIVTTGKYPLYLDEIDGWLDYERNY